MPLWLLILMIGGLAVGGGIILPNPHPVPSPDVGRKVGILAIAAGFLLIAAGLTVGAMLPNKEVLFATR